MFSECLVNVNPRGLGISRPANWRLGGVVCMLLGLTLARAEPTLPDPESSDYITIQEVFSEQPEMFNYEERLTRSIRIIGKTVLIDAGSTKNNFHAIYNQQANIRDLTIYAETLFIRSRLHLPQTNITLHVRHLRFEDVIDEPSAGLLTKPVGLEQPPGNAGEAMAGAHGLRAGDINAYLQTFEPWDIAADRFAPIGGDGQPGSEGLDGERGQDLDECEENDQPPAINFPAPEGTVYIYELLGGVEERFICGVKDWPTDGKDAVADGKPGNGGQGGVLRSHLISSKFVNVAGGQGGETGETRSGGRAGRPQQAHHVRWGRVGGQPRFTSTARHSTRAGASAPAPGPDLPIGDSGYIDPNHPPDQWFHPFMLESIYQFALDAFNPPHNNAIFAHIAMQDYLAWFDHFQTTGGWQELTTKERA